MTGFTRKKTVVAVPARGVGSTAGRFVSIGLVFGLAFLVGTGKLGDVLPSFPNPFGSEDIDRSQPPLLESLVDLSRYQAASATFQVIVDTERDTRFVPSFVSGERTVFVAGGSVDATVDFSGLGEGAISVSEDRRSATVVLPAPVLAEPRVDPERSRVVSRDRGLLDRLGSVLSDTPTGERDLYVAAERKMQAAAGASDLSARAEENTRNMVEDMLRSLGFDRITVKFVPNPT